MRALAAILPFLLLLTAIPTADFKGAICGRPGYPDAGAYSDSAVVNASLWSELRAHGGFANGTTGSPAEVTVDAGSALYRVRLEEVTVRRFVGGTATDVPVVALRVREETPGGQLRATHNFTLVDVNRGGNLTLVAWASGGALEVFWRWAYLACDASFPNVYYVFHGRVASGAIADDNTLVYFEAPRAKSGIPADMILLITAGLSASVIFLLARRALKKGREVPETDDRTVK